NMAQLIPRHSQEVYANFELYESLKASMDPLYTQVKDLISTHFPDEYKSLCKYTDSLPMTEPAPAPPFAGLVYNLNVATELHRDWNDDGICVVVVISDCTGGELILVELGLVIELKNGDAIVFRSGDITHLNAHF
ncbi:hypothetical protein BDN72DRAFT_746515, partial [Pluteus cervinus]